MILSTESSFFTFKICRASSAVIRCSRVSLSVSEPEVAFPTPATSAPAAPVGRYFASADTTRERTEDTSALAPAQEGNEGQSKEVRTRDGLSPRSVERLPEDFRASDRNLHNDLW